jgi:CelD/BcsL family acetyltransferase involved in cellulose biosynthesis
MHPQHDWRFDYLKTWDEVWNSSFVARWQEWIDQSPDAHVFFEPSMIRAWVKCFQTHGRVEPRFVIGEHVSGCRVLFPLVRIQYGWKDSWCRILQAPGELAFDYNDPIFTDQCDEKCLSGFWNVFSKEVATALGADVDQIIVPLVRQSCVGASAYFTERSRAPYIDLRGLTGIDDLLANISRSVRSNVRYQARQLEKLGELKLMVSGPDEFDSANDTLAGLIGAYSDRWKSSLDEDWYRSMLLECLPTGFLHVSALLSNGTPISWHVGFLHKGRFYLYKVGFDSRFSEFSPGKVHNMKLIEESLRHGASAYEFLRGEEAYKYQWTKHSMGLYQLQIDGSGWRSQIALRARMALWANRKRFRQLRRRIDHGT